jgi:hypothetical protein
MRTVAISILPPGVPFPAAPTQVPGDSIKCNDGFAGRRIAGGRRPPSPPEMLSHWANGGMTGVSRSRPVVTPNPLHVHAPCPTVPGVPQQAAAAKKVSVPLSAPPLSAPPLSAPPLSAPSPLNFPRSASDYSA